MSSLKKKLAILGGFPGIGIKRQILVYLIPSSCLLLLTALEAKPSHMQVMHGQAQILPSDDPNHMVIQSGEKTVLHWDQFSLDVQEHLHFLQANSQSAILNRVCGQEASSLLGHLSSNGKVFFINPWGISIGPHAHIQTAGFIASTLDVLDEDFFQDKVLNFSGNSKGVILNQGTIESVKGDLLLVARTIKNEGSLQAPGGYAGAAAGYDILFNPSDSERIFIKVASLDQEPDTEIVAIHNSGKIEAAVVELRGSANLYAKAILHEGSIRSVIEEGGELYLVACPGKCDIQGSLDASGKDQGGTIKVLGDEIVLGHEAKVYAEGKNRGGNVFIGGGEKGLSLSPKAQFVTVEEGAAVHVSALEKGDAGKAIFWADQLVDMKGGVYANGGKEGGAGGFIEISKNFVLNPLMHVHVDSVEGNIGEIYLDPTNITISGADSGGSFSGCVSGTNTFTASGSGNTINTATLSSLLNAPCNVTISTSSGGSDEGSITVSNAISWSSASTLTLLADAYIFVNNTITASGNGSLVLTANPTRATLGSFYGIRVAGAISCAGSGSVTLSGSGGNSSSDSVNGVTVVSPISVNSGNITFQNCYGGGFTISGASYCRGVSVENTLTSTSGQITFSQCQGGGGSLSNNSGTNNFGALFGANISAPTIQTTGNGFQSGNGGGSPAVGGAIGLYIAAGTIGGANTTTLNLFAKSNGVGSATGASQGAHGIYMGGGTLYIGDGGTMTLEGVGGGSIANATSACAGIYVGAGTIRFGTSTGATATFKGTGGLSSATNNSGVYLAGTGNWNGNNTVNFTTCTGGAANSGSNVGVYVGMALTAGSGGSVNFRSVSGGGSSSSTGSNYGVQVAAAITAGTIQSSTDGVNSYQIQGGLGTGGQNVGLVIGNQVGYTTSSVSTINLTATGGSGSSSHAISVLSTVRTGTSGSGTITLSGTGSASSTGSSHGISVSGSGAITSQGGAISLTGTANGTGTSCGILVANSNSISSTSGAISLSGTSNATGSSSFGVSLTASQAFATTATPTAVSIVGIGGTGSHGINIGAALSLTNTGSGISLNGTAGSGGSAYGTNFGSTVTTRSGTITVTGSSLLSTAATFDSTTAGATTGANISFNGTIDGAQTLSLRAGSAGAIVLGGSIGSTSALTSLTVVSAKTSADAISIGGNITAGTLTISTTSPTVITATSTITTTNTAISFPSTIDGPGGLSLNPGASTITLNANIGSTTPLASFTASAATTLATNIAITTTGALNFSSTVNGAQTLTLNSGTGAITFSGAVGGSTALTSLSATTTTGGSITQGSTVQTTGAVNYTSPTQISLNGASITTTAGGSVTLLGPVTLGANCLIDTTNSGGYTGANIVFSGSTSTINGAHTLTLTSGTQAITLDGAIGESIRLSSLTATTTTGGSITQSSDVHTTGVVQYTSPTNIFLNGPSITTTSGAVTFTGPVELGASVLVDTTASASFSGASIIFSGSASTIDGENDLTLSSGTGTITFAAEVGLSTPLSSLTATTTSSGSIVQESSVETTGSVHYTSPTQITLNGSSITTNTDGDVTCTGPVILGGSFLIESAEDILFSSTVNANAPTYDLTMDAPNGGISFQGNVGNTTPLATITVNDCLTFSSSGSITTTEDITITGADLTFNGPISTTVQGDVTLHNTGAVVIGSNADMDLEGSFLQLGGLGSVSTGGDITANPASGTAIQFTSPITLTDDVTFLSNNRPISFFTNLTRIDGTYNLTINAGSSTVLFNGLVGGLTPLESLQTTASGGITVHGDQTVSQGPMIYQGPVTLTDDTNFTNAGSGGNLIFTASPTAIQGNYDLEMNASNSAVTVTGTINVSGSSGTAGGNVDIEGLSGITISEGIVSLGGDNSSGPGGSGGNISLVSSNGSIAFRFINASGGASLDSAATGGNGGEIFLQPSNALGSLNIPQGIVRINADTSGDGNLVSSGGDHAIPGNQGSGGLITITANRSSFPTTATIVSSVAGNDVTIFGGIFRMGAYEQMTVLGDLSITTSSSMTMGDTIALNNLSLSTITINLRTRESFNILNNEGELYPTNFLHFYGEDVNVVGLYNPSGPIQVVNLSTYYTEAELRELLIYDSTTILNLDLGISPPSPTPTPENPETAILYQMGIAESELMNRLPPLYRLPYHRFRICPRSCLSSPNFESFLIENWVETTRS